MPKITNNELADAIFDYELNMDGETKESLLFENEECKLDKENNEYIAQSGSALD